MLHITLEIRILAVLPAGCFSFTESHGQKACIESGRAPRLISHPRSYSVATLAAGFISIGPGDVHNVCTESSRVSCLISHPGCFVLAALATGPFSISLGLAQKASTNSSKVSCLISRLRCFVLAAPMASSLSFAAARLALPLTPPSSLRGSSGLMRRVIRAATLLAPSQQPQSGDEVPHVSVWTCCTSLGKRSDHPRPKSWRPCLQNSRSAGHFSLKHPPDSLIFSIKKSS